ncbi:MAG: cytochrome c3 family protein [Bacteroidales bacterium]|nr:cytochrome c3 family protein [Bacteroidales bacterium]
MKKLNLFLTLFLVFTFANLSIGQITGTGHDFSGNAWANGEICIVCHTPHNGIASDQAPLWNHEITTATYTLYDNTTSSTFNATTGQPAANSLLCLSCHDGTIALENFGGVDNGTNYIPGGANLGINLSNDHPIGFTYDAALVTADGGLNAPPAALLFAGRMECASCHNVHDNTHGHFLRMPNAGSALCLTCHDK